MARRKPESGRRSAVTSTANRVASAPLVSPLRTVKIRSFQEQVRELEDRRDYHPQGKSRDPRSTYRSDTRLIVAPIKKALKRPKGSKLVIPFRTSFSVAKRVSLCVRRHQRREVLFALKRVAKGSGSRKIRNQWSEIKC